MAKKKLKNKKSIKSTSRATVLEKKKLHLQLDTWFKIILMAVTLLFFYNCTFNNFSMDDYHVNTSNPQTIKGFAGIPEIFTSLYAQENGMAYGYRPLVRTSFALEYQFTRHSKYNPYISHLINVLLYMLGIFIMYIVLRRLLRNYSPWFPFLATLLFLAHPLHTEVVASLKNRDIILAFIFSFLAIRAFVRWADFNKPKQLWLGMMFFIFALLSKETAIAQLAVFPLVLYFFTDLPIKKLGRFSLIAFIVAIFAAVGPFLFLPEFSRHMRFFENPLVAEPNYFLHLSTAFYIMGWYLILLLKPYPMSYYYGFDTIPIVNWANPWVWASLLFYLAIVLFALKNLPKKKLLSFIILYFIITISPYSNIVKPVPGIVADRFMFFPSLAFAMALVYLFFKLFGLKIKAQTSLPTKKLVWISILVLIILAPYFKLTHYRNHIWQTHYSLYREDMNHLRNSVKANDLFATECVNIVNKELAKPVNPYKFVKRLLDTAVAHYLLAVKLDPSQYASWNSMGAIYSKIHGNQALLRYRSYASRGKPEKAKIEIKNAKKYFGIARSYFKQAISIKPDFSSAYYNMAYSWDLQSIYDSAIRYYKLVLKFDTTNVQIRSRLANAYFRDNKLDSAKYENKMIIKIDPKSNFPYINMGNYFYMFGDTLNAIKQYEKALEVANNRSAAKMLSDYYSKKGNEKLATYYKRKMYEAERQRQSKTEKDAKRY